MVRKRSRTSRKYYESDDNDTDSDYDLDDSPTEAPPKKYSLRQRKRALFIDDYDYEDADDVPEAKPSDDEDFEVEKEVAPPDAPAGEYVGDNVYVNHTEGEALPDDNELIDFEDVIRADIVVNKNRIDYDNVISKTEIKVQPIPVPTVEKPRAKRGRKPKPRPETEIDSSLLGHFLEPETDLQEDCDDRNDKDYDPNEELDFNDVPLVCVQTELEDTDQNQDEEQLDNGENTGEVDENSTEEVVSPDQPTQPDSTVIEVTPDDPLETSDQVQLPERRNVIQGAALESVIKFNEGYLNSPLAPTENGVSIENPELQLELKQELEEDDDVVLVEDKDCEVIVLDD